MTLLIRPSLTDAEMFAVSLFISKTYGCEYCGAKPGQPCDQIDRTHLDRSAQAARDLFIFPNLTEASYLVTVAEIRPLSKRPAQELVAAAVEAACELGALHVVVDGVGVGMIVAEMLRLDRRTGQRAWKIELLK